ncbi:GNAT family N-acetyltransferase [Phenylobacterium sp.]|uniref:GNAT family N-acetyltransferase n=1 Tax=Phenylobacterium sp. TaxID=1871053 RepID=UPI003D2D88BF
MIVAQGERVALRRIEASDLPQCAPHIYTLSIQEPLTDLTRVEAVFAETGFWTEDAGAVGIAVDVRLVGTLQFYRGGPGFHGYEIGYLIHTEADRGRGYASEALRLFGDLILRERPTCHRLQLIIETWNNASARLAEACGYVREGVMRRAGYSAELPEDCWLYSRIRP